MQSVKGRGHMDDAGIDWKMILKFIIKKLDGRVWGGFIWLRIRTTGIRF